MKRKTSNPARATGNPGFLGTLSNPARSNPGPSKPAPGKVAGHTGDFSLPAPAHSAPSGAFEATINDAGGTWGMPGSGTVGSGHGSKQHHPQDRNRGAEEYPQPVGNLQP